MKFSRRTVLHLATGAGASPALSRVARAQAYPSRPITLIVPIAAGSISDVAARVVAERMRKSLGQPVIIENVSGAGGNIGTGQAARAKPDGYTIDLGFNSSHALGHNSRGHVRNAARSNRHDHGDGARRIGL